MDLAWNVDQKNAAKQLLGRALRVALAEWILSESRGHFYLQEAQTALLATGEAPSGVAKELRLFVKYGLLSEYREDHRVYFSKAESRWWDVFAAAAAAVQAHGEVSTDPLTTVIGPARDEIVAGDSGAKP